MSVRTIGLNTLILCAALGLGCASNVDKQWGKAYASMNQKMLVDPEAGSVPDDGISDLEGVTVEGVLTRYRKEQAKAAEKSFKKSVLESGLATGN